MDEVSYETFEWCGQKRYRCRTPQDDGSPCLFDTYDLSIMLSHERGHLQQRKAPAVRTLYDADPEPPVKKQDPTTAPPAEHSGDDAVEYRVLREFEKYNL